MVLFRIVCRRLVADPRAFPTTGCSLAAAQCPRWLGCPPWLEEDCSLGARLETVPLVIGAGLTAMSGRARAAATGRALAGGLVW